MDVPLSSAQPRHRGFALVTTVSLLVLMALVAIGLLTLSTITLRSEARGSDLAEARANARLALLLAIGELQKHAGPDTRVTAPADILDESHPLVTGVWRSWEGTDHETRGNFRGRPIAPDYDAKEEAESGGGRFRAWLVSNADPQFGIDDLDTVVRSTSSSGYVPLLGEGSLRADDDREIHLKPVEFEDERGAYGWWISGENQKAYLPRPHGPVEDNEARWSDMVKSHAVPDPKPFELERLLDDAAPAAKAATRNSIAFISDPGAVETADKDFHDLSPHAIGLLTNTATGGWRKDLSLLTENWDALPRSGLPFFRITPDTTSRSARPRSGDPQPPQSMLYPWVGYRDVPGRPPIYQHGAVSSWHNLMDYATAYKRIRARRGGDNSIPFTARNIWNPGGAHEFLHKVRTIPVIARIHWVFSHQTSLRSPNRPAGRRTHRLHLLITPVVTVWNPHNVSITSTPLRIRIGKALPCAFRYDGSSQYYCLSASGSYPSLSNRGAFGYRFREPFTLGPGETRVFSPSSETAVPIASTDTLDLAPGYRPGSGHLLDVKGNGGQTVLLDSTASIKVDLKFDTTFSDGAHGVGIYVDMHSLNPNDWLLAYRMVYPVQVARKYWKPIPAAELTSPSAGEVMDNPQPFLSTVFGSRVASNSHLPGKGLVQTSPLVNYTVMGKTKEYGNIAHDYTGAYHPVNSPFDYSFLKHAPGDSRLPNANDATNRGYIVSGFDKSDGLSRIVLSEIPLRPLASLGDLQNWDMRYENPAPPYQLNVIGNSDASPLLPPNAVVNRSDARLTKNLQHDDAYCANHLLFDDWFFSSIAPDPSLFGPRALPMRTRFIEFLSGDRPLANRSYRPILEDRDLTRSAATTLYRREVTSEDGWQRIASRLEVEGMFNVNSTSVTAWRALLGHSRNHKIPYLTERGNAFEISLSGETDYAFPRFSVSGDVEAGKPGTGGAFPDSSEFTGYRRFEEETLDRLAEEVVEQVRERGPFLSLSEFVNRQLSSGDLALAGALQTALNNIAEGPGNPYAVLEALSDDAGIAPGEELDDAGYRFPEAAIGKSAYGLPGWTRQADVLGAIAPVLSARDDSFTIRTFGEARDASGQVTARVWCEAVVRRTRNYIDEADEADLTSAPSRPINRDFGRRFELVSFRWLGPGEV